MTDWSTFEVDLIIADYFAMLDKELAGIPYSKTEHRRQLMKLVNRNKGAIEFKHQNISAVLVQMGLPFITGYKPRYNFQKSLLPNRIFFYLKQHQSPIESRIELFADEQIPSSVEIHFNEILVAPPKPNKEEKRAAASVIRSPFKINYLEREQRNSRIGGIGEQIALDYERWRLRNTGNDKYVEKVEWISQRDDKAGFDILSRNPNGTDRYIEVKSTKLSKDTPIFFSKGEYQFSISNARNFHLYRVHNINTTPKIFTLHGHFDDFCRKEVLQYKGFF